MKTPEVTAQVSYTVEKRGGGYPGAVRKTVEVPLSKLPRLLAKLEERGAFSFDIRYEVPKEGLKA